MDKFDLMTPNLHGEEVARLRAEIADLRGDLNDALAIIKEKNESILELKRNKGIPEMQEEIAELRERIKQDELGFGFMLDANRKLTAENAQLRADLEKCLHALDDEVLP